METYFAQRNSGVVSYDIEESSGGGEGAQGTLTVNWIQGGSTTYDVSNINLVRNLAEAGYGLNAYINKNLK
jgi:hypothetical protein